MEIEGSRYKAFLWRSCMNDNVDAAMSVCDFLFIFSSLRFRYFGTDSYFV